jgi:DNA polymerase-3 subunit alpha
MQQFSLLGADVEYIVEKAEDLSDAEKSIMEFEVCGVFLRTHPISQYSMLLEAKNTKNSYQLKYEITPGSYKIDIAGIIQKKDSRLSARGRFITVQLSDGYGNFEVTIFNESVLKEYVELLELQKMVVVTCDLFKDEGGGRLTAIKFYDIEEYLSKDLHEMTIHLGSMEELEQLTKTLLAKKSDTVGTKTQLTVFVPGAGNMIAKISLPPVKLMLGDVAELKAYENNSGVIPA